MLNFLFKVLILNNFKAILILAKEIEQDFNEQDIEQKENVPFYLRVYINV